jgi:hypothetical protein
MKETQLHLSTSTSCLWIFKTRNPKPETQNLLQKIAKKCLFAFIHRFNKSVITLHALISQLSTVPTFEQHEKLYRYGIFEWGRQKLRKLAKNLGKEIGSWKLEGGGLVMREWLSQTSPNNEWLLHTRQPLSLLHVSHVQTH